MNTLSCFALAGGLALAAAAGTSVPAHQDPATQDPTKQDSATQTKKAKPMQLGNFSVSLAVKDLKASRAFYEKLDFQQVAGEAEKNWLILQNGGTTIGLFQGMFEKNIMTFNPGWDKDQNTLEGFQDVRELQRTLKERGIKPVQQADETSTGPASFILADPDGNTVFFDQHVGRPKK